MFVDSVQKTCYDEFYKDIELTIDETTEVDTVTDDTTNIIAQLILEVEKRRPLWDHRLQKMQRYPNVVNRLWEEIVKELNSK